RVVCHGGQLARSAAAGDYRGAGRLPAVAGRHQATDAEPAPVLASPPSSRQRASASSARSASARFFSAPRAGRASGGGEPPVGVLGREVLRPAPRPAAGTRPTPAP